MTGANFCRERVVTRLKRAALWKFCSSLVSNNSFNRSAGPLQLFSALMVTAAVTFVGCSRPPVVTVANHSAVTISNIVVLGSGCSNWISSIPAGAAHTLAIHPRGESGVRLAFDAGARHVDSGEQQYIEASGGYRIKAVVNTNLSVAITSALGSY